MRCRRNLKGAAALRPIALALIVEVASLLRTAQAEVIFTLVFSRHGIRTPYPPEGIGTLTRESLKEYTDQDFPACYPPGPDTSDVWGTSTTAGLTRRGAENLWKMGAWMGRANFSKVRCEEVALYADFEDSRDNHTATNWSSGAFPSCPQLHRSEALLGGSIYKLLFNAGNDLDVCQAPDASIEQALIGGPQGDYAALRSAYAGQIRLVDSIVKCCPMERCGFEPCNMSSLPIEFKGEFWTATTGAFNQLGYWSSFFLLEALNGNPTFALGRLTLEQVVSLYQTEIAGLEQIDNHFAAPAFASTLAVYIAASLTQAATGMPSPLLEHGPEAKVVYMAGHDTNLVLLRHLMDLRWFLPGWFPNAVPVGGMLIFELHQEGQDFFVHAFFQGATPVQMRETADFSKEPPSRVPVPVPGCTGKRQARLCRLDDFVQVVLSRVRAECVGIGDLPDFLAGAGAMAASATERPGPPPVGQPLYV